MSNCNEFQQPTTKEIDGLLGIVENSLIVLGAQVSLGRVRGQCGKRKSVE